MAKWMKADGTTEAVAPKNGESFKLKELQAFVGGSIEIAYPRSRRYWGQILVCNEEGLLRSDFVVNAEATRIMGSPLVGDVLLCNDEEVH